MELGAVVQSHRQHVPGLEPHPAERRRETTGSNARLSIRVSAARDPTYLDREQVWLISNKQEQLAIRWVTCTSLMCLELG
jgi:hypothetical protein